MRQLLNSLGDLSEKTGTVFFLMFERLFLIVFGFFTLSTVIGLAPDIPYLFEAGNQNVMFFTEVYTGNNTRLDPDPVIRRTIDEGIGYLLISYAGDQNVYIVGNYDMVLDNVSHEMPFAAYGSGIEDSQQGDTLTVGDFTRMEIPIIDIDQKTVYRAGHKIDLTDKIMIAMSYDDYMKVSYHQGLINFLHVVDPSEEQMQWIMEGLNGDGIRVLPESVANYRRASFKNNFGVSLMYFVLILLCTVFMCLHLFACEAEIINRKSNEYYINRLYGCSRRGIFARIFLTMIQTVIVPVILIVLFGRRFLGNDLSILPAYMALVAAFYIIAGICFTNYVDRKILN